MITDFLIAERSAEVGAERSRRWAVAALVVMGSVLACAAFQWGGVVRTGRYEYLLALGLLVLGWSLWASPERQRGGRVTIWAAGLLPAYVLLQCVPLPVSVLRDLSPARAAGVEALGPVGAGVQLAPLAVFPAGTFQYFLLVCGYVVIYFVARELTGRFRQKSVWLTAWPILVVAALEAMLGLGQYFYGNGTQVRWGTYANHNHLAGFLEMSLPFAVMYPVALLERGRARVRASVAPLMEACGVWAIAGIVFAGIVYSLSRMGFLSALFSFFVMGILVLATRQRRSPARFGRRQLGTVGVVAVLAVASFVFLPPDQLIRRFANFVSADGLTDEGRSGLWIETMPLIRSYPIFGCGLGGYETAFSKFKISGLLVTDDFAHNDYLQLLAELGLAGFVIGAALALSILRSALHSAVKSSEPDTRYLGVACVGALAAIGLHSLADFNLYIPANAMLLAWVAGMAVGVSLRAVDVDIQTGWQVPKVSEIEAWEVGSHH